MKAKIDNDSVQKQCDVTSIIFMDISVNNIKHQHDARVMTATVMQGVKFLSFINLLKSTEVDLGWRKSHLMASDDDVR